LKKSFRFPGQVAIVLAAGVAIAVATGMGLATVNALAGYRALLYAQGKSYTTFLKVVLGGTGIRIAVLLGALVLLIKVAGMHPVALTVSLLSFYVIFLLLEILCIQRNVLPPNQG
jgi:hypothetical protein